MKEFFDSLLFQKKKCPWTRSRKNLKDEILELESEVQELKEAVEKNDVENMCEELGDVFWDAFFFGILAEEKGLFTLKEVFEGVHEKLKRRKPWVFGNETVSTPEEAVKRWNEIKVEEKKAKLNSINEEKK